MALGLLGVIGAARLNPFVGFGNASKLALLSAFLGVIGAARLNPFVGFGNASKLALLSAFLGVSDGT